jgi:hypothetical protein
MAKPKIKPDEFGEMPACAIEYINLVIQKMRYRKKARDEVREELFDHFEVYLKDCATNEEKEQKAQRLLSEFGDPKILAVLMRRAKKRCRPLWQKIIVRSFVVALVIFAYLFICAFWLRMGTPTIRINYAQWLTDQQKQGRDESLNASPEINKAAELTRKTNDWMTAHDILRLWPGDMNDNQKTAARNFLETSDETLNMLNKALEKPYFWTDYNSGGPIIIEVNSVPVVNPVFMNNIMQPLTSYRQIAYILVARINWRAYSGDIDGTVNDLITLIRFSSHLQGRGLLVEQLVATAIEALACNRTTMILSRVDIPAAQLKRLQDELSVNFAKRECPIDLNGEKAFWYEHIQHGFTDDGKGNGRILRAGTIYFVRDWKDAIWSFLTFSYPDRRQTLAQVEGMFAESWQKFQVPPWQMKNRISAKQSVAATPFVWSQIIGPAIDNISPIAWRTKTQREATLTILACLRFQKEKGKFPDNLEELVQTGYLTKLPVDPFSNGPLTYKKTADGFILYSWGSNLKDDGGQVIRDEKGKSQKFADTGDWVFWPVEKN